MFLRGKAHVEWKVTRGGERRTVKEDQYFIDDKAQVWGKGEKKTNLMLLKHPGAVAKAACLESQRSRVRTPLWQSTFKETKCFFPSHF